MSSFCATIHVRKVCLLVYELFESPLSCALITFERVSRILRCTGWESTPNLHELFIIDLDSLSSRLFSLSLSLSLLVAEQPALSDCLWRANSARRPFQACPCAELLAERDVFGEIHATVILYTPLVGRIMFAEFNARWRFLVKMLP